MNKKTDYKKKSSHRKKNWCLIFILRAGPSDEAIQKIELLILNYLNNVLPNNHSIYYCISCHKDILRTLRIPFVEKNTAIEFTTVFLKVKWIKNIFPDIRKKVPRLLKKNIRFELINSNEELNLQDENQVRDFFAANIRKEEFEKRLLLYTWDHGCPFGIFTSDFPTLTQSEQLTGTNTTIVVTDREKRLKEFTNAKLFDFYGRYKTNETPPSPLEELFNEFQNKNDGGILTMKELSEALKAILPKGKKLDIIVLDNCDQQYIDTLFQLKEVSKFLVAAQKSISMDGFNIPAVSKKLVSKKGMHAVELANFLVLSYSKKRGYHKTVRMERLSDLSLFASEIQRMEHIFTTTYSIIQQLDIAIKEHPSLIISARVQTAEIDGAYYLVDFIKFCSNLKKELNSKTGQTPVENELIKLIRDLKRIYSRPILTKYTHDKNRPGKNATDKHTLQENSFLFTICFPNKVVSKFGDFWDSFKMFIENSSEIKTKFQEEFPWESFVIKYIDAQGAQNK